MFLNEKFEEKVGKKFMVNTSLYQISKLKESSSFVCGEAILSLGEGLFPLWVGVCLVYDALIDIIYL